MRFFCDTMLGRLAKWLRLLGFDTAYESEIDDWDLVRQGSLEDRVLLTRDREIMKRWQVVRGKVKASLIGADRIDDQLAEAITRFGLKPGAQARCPEDNSVLEALPREEAQGRVPPYVFETQHEYRACPVCGRVYWKATHWEKIDRVRRSLSS